MPFIGKSPQVGAFQLIDSITTSATDTYALTVSGSAYVPESARNLIVSLNGVTQAPETAYTVSGSNIVFASALTASDVIDYILVIGDAVDIGTPSDNTVGDAQLKAALDLSSKTLTFANDQISGDVINGGTISSFASTGIDDNATSTAITINSDEEVGVGAINPQKPLHVIGGILAASSDGSTSGITIDSTVTAGYASTITHSDTGIEFDTGSTLRDFTFDVSGSELMRIDTSSGNVGIGTTSPTGFAGYTSLDINNATNGAIIDLSQGDAMKGRLVATSSTMAIETSAGVPLIFQPVGSEAARFDGNGHLIVGNTVVDSASSVTLKNEGSIRSVHASGAGGDSLFGGISGVSNGYQILIDSSNNQTYKWHNGGTPSMTIDSSGRVGIGITSMVNPLHVGVTPNTNSKTSGSAFDGGALRLDGLLSTTDSEVAILGGPNDSLSSGIGFARQSSSDWGTQIRFYTHGTAITTTDELTERMRIDASGLVGINTTNPSTFLEVAHFTTGIANNITTYNSNTAASAECAVDWALNRTGSEAKIRAARITAGKEQTWTTTPSTVDGYLKFLTVRDESLNEAMRITSNGTTNIGTTAASGTNGNTGIGFTQNGRMISNCDVDWNYEIYGAQGNRLRFFGSQGGGTQVGSVTVTTSATSYNTTSDERLKENIVDAPAGNIDDIRVRSFDWKADGSHQTYGMVAQELVDVAPEAVSQGETEDDMWGVDYSKLVPMMIKEIQDLRARVAQLEGA